MLPCFLLAHRTVISFSILHRVQNCDGQICFESTVASPCYYKPWPEEFLHHDTREAGHLQSSIIMQYASKPKFSGQFALQPSQKFDASIWERILKLCELDGHQPEDLGYYKQA